jgi:hypothetical protein
MRALCGHYADTSFQMLHRGSLHSTISVKDHIALLYTP